MSAQPQPLPAWSGAEPDYSRCYLVCVPSTDPRALEMTLWERGDPPAHQSELTAEYIDERNGKWKRVKCDTPAPVPAERRCKLDLKLKANNALLVFKLEDPDSTFMASDDGSASVAVVKSASDSSNHLFSSQWVEKGTATAVSTILSGKTKGFSYGLGIDVRDGDYLTPIFIDPKIDNDGDG